MLTRITATPLSTTGNLLQVYMEILIQINTLASQLCTQLLEMTENKAKS